VLAPRSIRHVYATAACMFRTALRASEGDPPEERRQGRLLSGECDLHAGRGRDPHLGHPSRHRRGHDLRCTFITLAQVDGARRDLLETITHGPRGNIINVYTTFPWPALCAEVAKLRIKKIGLGSRKSARNRGPRDASSTESRDRFLPILLPLSETGGIAGEICDPRGIRTLVRGLKGHCPGPG
jgi:hypothetical protein